MSDFFSKASRKATRVWPASPAPPRPGSPDYAEKIAAHFHQSSHLEAGRESQSDLYRTLTELANYCPPKRVLGADGRIYLALAREDGSADPSAASAFPWQVVITGSVISIAAGSRLWHEFFEDVTSQIVNYDPVAGWTTGTTGTGFVCFKVEQDASYDLTGLSIVEVPPDDPLYHTSGGRITHTNVPIAALSGGAVSTQFVWSNPVLQRQNIRGYYGFWAV